MLRRALLLLAFSLAAIVSGCRYVPPDAIRGATRVVVVDGGACAFFSNAPTRCWGWNRYARGEGEGWERQAYARVSLEPDARELASADARWDGRDCLIDVDGRVSCDAAMRWIAPGVSERLPALRSSSSMRQARSIAVAPDRVCVLVGTIQDSREQLWCARLPGLVGEGVLDTTPTLDDAWERIDWVAPDSAQAVSLGAYGMCVLFRSHVVRCERSDGASDEVIGTQGAVQLAMGEDFACVRLTDGDVACWGGNSRGQLGDGTLDSRPIARRVALGARALDLAIRGRRACVIADGDGFHASPVCWGELRPPYGALAGQISARPQPDAKLEGLGQLALGTGFSCAIAAADGTVWCWGYDAHGALGDGSSLPGASCHREGIDGTSPERERPGGPSAVRTGEAGVLPRWQLPFACSLTLLVIAPWMYVVIATRRALRARAAPVRGRDFASVAIAGAILALLSPVIVTRLFVAYGAIFGQHIIQRGYFGTPTIGWRADFALGVLGPAAAFIATAVPFHRLLSQLRASRPLRADVLTMCAAILLIAIPALLAAMSVTLELNLRTDEELTYLLRTTELDLGPLYAVRWAWTIGWMVVAGICAFAAATYWSHRNSE